MKTVILAFNIPVETMPKLKMLCAFVKTPVKAIPADRFGCTIASLAAGTDQPCVEATAFSEPMLVMADLSKSQFDMFLQGMKRFGIPKIPLKAVLTPYNAEWTANRLYSELSAERAAFESGSRAHGNS